jgi:hypothetical protein
VEQFLRCGFRAGRSWILGENETKVLETRKGRKRRACVHGLVVAAPLVHVFLGVFHDFDCWEGIRGISER